MKTAYQLYLEGVGEIEGLGYTVSSGSYAFVEHVAVFSLESIPDTYGASRVCFNAVFLDEKWIIQRVGYAVVAE